MSGQIVVQRVGRGSSGGTCKVAPEPPGLPVMRTGKVCELVPLCPSSNKWSREREREPGQGGSGEVGERG